MLYKDFLKNLENYLGTLSDGDSFTLRDIPGWETWSEKKSFSGYFFRDIAAGNITGVAVVEPEKKVNGMKVLLKTGKMAIIKSRGRL